MKHEFEFYMKAKHEDAVIHMNYQTKSARLGKVAEQILEKINGLRQKEDLAPWTRDDLSEFKMRKVK